MNSIKMKAIAFLSVLVTIVITGCSKDPEFNNQKPNLNSSDSTEGLKIT